MEQVTHIHLVLNYVHLFSHLSVVHRHKLAETSLRWGTVYHNNMLPALFLPLSRSLSFSHSLSLSLKLRQPVVVFAIWCGSSVVAAERRNLLPCRSIRLCMRGGKLQLRCRLFAKKSGKGTRAGGKRGVRERFLFQICKCRHRDKVAEREKRLWNNF